MSRNRTTSGLIVGFLLLIGFGCTPGESKIFEGKVVDEQGNPLQGVSITLCYTGWKWDWEMAGGFPLTIDHPFCSDAVATDRSGTYKVIFSGPPSTVIHARHPDWIQTRSFLAGDNLVVLVRKGLYLRRQKEKEEKKEKAFRQRRTNESPFEYYCRVVQARSGRIELDYHGQKIKIVQSLLVNDNKAIFAMEGPPDTAQALAGELRIRQMNLQALPSTLDNFTVHQQKDMCGNNMYYIQFNALEKLFALNKAGSVRIEIPALRAVFTMKIWNLS